MINDLLPLPQKMDENEWVFIISFIILVPLILWLPKKFPTSITWLLLIFGGTVPRIFDKVLASPKTDYYDVFDTGKYELFDLISYPLYSVFAYIFVYIYAHFRFSNFKFVIFIVISSLLGTAFEYLSSLFNMFHYKEWTIFFSFTVYLIIQPLTILFYLYIVQMHSKLTINSNTCDEV
ncbi:MAG: hypothetical protein LPK00_01850 [Bacillaceae bacterium]|nr:hypothetical protein [Bacillaceae bacterium]